MFLVSVIISTLILIFIIPQLLQKYVFKKKYYIGMVGEYNLNTLPDEINNLITKSLVEIKEDGNFQSSLAKMEINEEGKSYAFVFNHDLKWQDGKKFSLEDIDYQFQNKDVEIVKNNDKLIFQLKDTLASFPSSLTEKLLKFEYKKKLFFFNKIQVIGFGPGKIKNFKFSNHSQNSLKEVIISDKRKEYVFRFYFTEDDLLTSIKKGEVDFAFNLINTDNLNEFENLEITKEVKTNHYLGLFFNNSNDFLTKNLRIAFSYALSKVDENTDQIRAIGTINPKSWAFLKASKLYDQNLSKAMERLLSDQLPIRQLEFTLDTTYQFVNEANIIKEELEALGKKTVEKCLSDDDIEKKDNCQNLNIKIHLSINLFPDTNNFQMLLVGQEIPSDPDQYHLWHSSQATNFTKYKNTKVDSLLEKGRQVISQDERTIIYQDFQQELLEDPPVIFLRYLNYYNVARKSKLKGANFFSNGFNQEIK
jgi:peptide/nickel transport system substrate-binding protein